MKRDPAIAVLASLAAAIRLLRRAEEIGKRPSQAVGSDKMFKQMLRDYEAALENGREAMKGVK